jgi:hypothetical protein
VGFCQNQASDSTSANGIAQQDDDDYDYLPIIFKHPDHSSEPWERRQAEFLRHF